MKKIAFCTAIILPMFLTACGTGFKTPVVDGERFSTRHIKANGENGQLIIERKNIERGIYVVATQDRYSKTSHAGLTEIIKARFEKNGIKVVDKVEDAAIVIKFVPIGLKSVDISGDIANLTLAALGFKNDTLYAGSGGGRNRFKLALVGFVDLYPKYEPMSAEFINGVQQRARLDTDYDADDDVEAAKSIKAMVDLWVEAYIKG